VAYNILVILWGAFVRATGSGAGCGDHWPLCDGQVIPRAPDTAQLIEFSHRLTSGLSLIGTVVLMIWAVRIYSRGNYVRRWAFISLVLMIIEALIGAGLVLLGLVADNSSFARAIALALHLMNTLLLLGALTLTAWFASGNAPIRLRDQGRLPMVLGIGLLGTMIVGASGAVTALGDTLLMLGVLPGDITQPFAPNSHPLVQLRIWHPVLGLLMTIYGWFLARTVSVDRSDATTQRMAWAFIALMFAQVAVGCVNVTLKAPVPMQLFHLFMADLVWIALVLLSASALADPAAETETTVVASRVPARI
jgi:cytochrome c oxidase assembly protein subunit 15